MADWMKYCSSLWLRFVTYSISEDWPRRNALSLYTLLWVRSAYPLNWLSKSQNLIISTDSLIASPRASQNFSYNSPQRVFASIIGVIFTNFTIIRPPLRHSDRSPHGQDGQIHLGSGLVATTSEVPDLASRRLETIRSSHPHSFGRRRRWWWGQWLWRRRWASEGQSDFIVIIDIFGFIFTGILYRWWAVLYKLIFFSSLSTSATGHN